MDKHSEILIPIGGIAYAQSGILRCAAVGSCIAVAIHNSATSLTGMAHIFLPGRANSSHSSPNAPGKYADRAVDELVSTLLRGRENTDGRLSAFAAGGARMFPIRQAHQEELDIGSMNSETVRRMLDKYNIPVKFWDIGGQNARTVFFDISKLTMTAATIPRNMYSGQV